MSINVFWLLYNWLGYDLWILKRGDRDDYIIFYLQRGK